MFDRTVICAGVLLALFMLIGSAHAEKKVKFGKVSDEEWGLGAPEDYPEANVIVILSRAELHVKASNIVTEYLYRYKILTEAGIDEIGDQSIAWNTEYDKIKSFKAHTITPDGKKHKVDKKSIFNKKSGKFKVRTFSFPVLSTGCIVEYRYISVSKRFWYLEPWDFQTDTYTLKSSFSTSVPNGWTYNVLYRNVPPMYTKAAVTERPDLDRDLGTGAHATIKTYTWTRENLLPITDEPYMAADQDYRSSLRFQIVAYEDRWNKLDYYESWTEKGESWQKYSDKYCNKSKEVKKIAETVTAGLTDPHEKSRAIYAYVIGEYKTSRDYTSRYFVHEKMSELLEIKSGSGEGKNLLLCEMHRAVGIQAWPVMISTRSHGKFDPKYPDLRQFNYLISFIQFDKKYEFIDCGSRLSPYGLLPPKCLTTGGLLIDGAESQLVRIPEPGIYSGRTDRTRMYVDVDGLVTCSTNCNFRGYYASLYGGRYERNTPEDFVEEYFLERLGSGYSMGNFECRLDSADCFVMSADYTVEDMAIQLDDNMLIKPVSFAFRSNPFESEKRFFPVDFNYPFTYKNAVEIFSEGTVSEYTLPENIDLDIGGASFTRECRQTDSSVTIVSTLIIAKPEFLPVTYKRLREFFDQVALTSEDEVIAVMAAGE